MNTDTLSKAFIFAAGVAIGAGVTWKILKDRYNKLMQEEVKSIREVFSDDESAEDEDIDISDVEEEIEKDFVNADYVKELTKAVSSIIKKESYSSYSSAGDNKKEEREVEEMDEPYVISPDDYDTNGYKTVTLWYHADGVLTDENHKPIKPKNIDKLIGRESLNHFGEYEDCSVYVRNDRLKTDYEILEDADNYYDN